MIAAESLSYAAGKFNLHDVSLRVEDSETVVILGPTGAGKTVLLELLAGFRRPSEGSVLIGDRDVTQLPPERRGIGFVYQDYLLFPHRSVQDNISYGLEVQNLRREEITKRVDEIAKRAGILPLLDRRTRNLSGGEQQRVALARALVTEPKVLLLDEPFAAVDPNTKETLMREMGRLLDKNRIPVIYVTHDQVEAMEMADRIAVMNEGRLVQVDEPEKVFSEPKSEFVASFVGTRNIFKGKSRLVNGGSIVEVGSVELRSNITLEGHVHMTIRPEDILVSGNEILSSARNSLKGRIISIVEKGQLVYLTGDCGIEVTAAITRESLRELELTVGDEVFLTFKASSVNLF